jgi:hypothetical protein
MREQILDQQAEDGKQHDVMVAGHQERERRRERLNSEAAERAHEAATRRRKVESGAVWFRAALLGKDLTCQPNQTSRSRLDCVTSQVSVG